MDHEAWRKAAETWVQLVKEKHANNGGVNQPISGQALLRRGWVRCGVAGRGTRGQLVCPFS